MEFESANALVVRSIKQRVLLNAWLRALERPAPLPAIADFKPDGLADELPDMMAFDVVGTGEGVRFFAAERSGFAYEPQRGAAMIEFDIEIAATSVKPGQLFANEQRIRIDF